MMLVYQYSWSTLRFEFSKQLFDLYFRTTLIDIVISLLLLYDISIRQSQFVVVDICGTIHSTI